MFGYVTQNPVNFVDPSGLDPGDQFHSAGEAAGDAINFSNPTSIKQNLEYGGYIVRNSNGTYSATYPIGGSTSGLNLPKPPKGTVADYHTHGASQIGYDSESFSKEDIWSNAIWGIDGYLDSTELRRAIEKRVNMSKKIITFIVSSLLASIVSASDKLPENGVLPNEEAAIRTAESILVNVYGDKILNQRPFKARLENDVWKITGTFHCPSGANCKGGVATIELNKRDGKVKNLVHNK
ncbi:NTF2 fold immunity protein [Bdellovibrio sp. HCB2-146]|uniref:NTF2 fold immunity protein n=1 Tax=Bdellovibrio sp. HCB2-146 TaxID=3394362 RepID=UPI0039BC2B86